MFIPYGKQAITQDDIDSVVGVLKSDFLTQGPAVTKFEQSIAAYCGAKYALAACNATAALHIACLALGVGKGDVVWTSPISFVASSNCALYCGANVDFVDIDPQTYNMSVEILEEKLAKAKRQNALPKVVIPVHLAGQSCNMKRIHELGQQYGFKIIEDASHAIGGEYLDKKIGCCEYSDISVFSFHPVKIITTGEGGMLTTNNPEINKTLRLLVTHGITKDPDSMQDESHGLWYHEQQVLGFNYRMPDINASLGNSQLKKLDIFVEKRHKIAEFYNKLFKGSAVVTPWQARETYSAYHLYIIQVEEDLHNKLFEHLRNNEVGVQLHYIPIYKQPFYQKLGFDYNYCQNAESYYKKAISLPMYYTLAEVEQERVAKLILTL